MKRPALLAAAWFLAAAAPPPTGASFGTIVDGYFQAQWAAHPVQATQLGLHATDDRIDDVSAAAIGADIKRLHATLTALRQVDAGALTPAQRDDRDVLEAEIGGTLLDEEQVQSWRHNPDTYVGLATGAIYGLIERDFAPLPLRIQQAIAREREIPRVLRQARANLAAMPRVYIEIALEDAAGADSFFAKDVPQAFAAVHDPALTTQLKASTAETRRAMSDYRAWLKHAIKTAPTDFAYGDTKFRGLLAADMIDLTPQQVLAAGTAQLARDQATFAATSALIDPAHPGQALDAVTRDHPDGAHLIATAAGQLAMVQDFVRSHHIVTLPSDALPLVTETPPFQRAEIFGAMDAPGPFETKATQAYYYITPPDASDSKAAQDQYLSYFNRPLLLNLTVHEAMPGHFVQFLYAKAHPDWSVIRKTAGSYTATEGWAHYSEQMMADAGLDANDPKRRLAQLQDALLRDCRLIVSVRMHTMGMSLTDATHLMHQSCYQPDDVAYKEARRGTADPGYFSYTLGKLMILKLRADRMAQLGPKFSVQAFHDAFLSAGLVPLRIIRREITGQDGSLL